jgi:hypothetical protein
MASGRSLLFFFFFLGFEEDEEDEESLSDELRSSEELSELLELPSSPLSLATLIGDAFLFFRDFGLALGVLLCKS